MNGLILQIIVSAFAMIDLLKVLSVCSEPNLMKGTCGRFYAYFLGTL